MHIQWFTTLVTETSCVIVNGFWAYWTPQKNIKNDKKKTNLNLLSSFKVSKFQESSTTYLSKHHTLITNSKTNSNRLNNTAERNLLTSMHIMRGLPLTIQTWLNPNYSPICILSYRIPRIIARGDHFSFRTKGGDYSREGDYLREAIISLSNIALWKSCPKYFV